MQSITLAKGRTMEEPGSCFFVQMKSGALRRLGWTLLLAWWAWWPRRAFLLAQWRWAWMRWARLMALGWAEVSTQVEVTAPDFIWTKKQDPGSSIVLPLAMVMDCIFLNLPPGLTAGREKAYFLKLTPHCWKSSRIIP